MKKKLMKKRLHIHSDNAEWAGSENMVGVFLNSPLVAEQFDVTFSYRSTPEYTKGMFKWVGRMGANFYPLHLPVTRVYEWARTFRPAMALRYPCMEGEVRKFKDLFSVVKPDVVHINNGGYPGATSCNSAAIAAGLFNVPVIYMINSTTRDLWWERPITGWVKKSVTRFVTASETLMYASEFLWNGDWRDPLENWAIIPNTVMWREPEDRDTVRAALGADRADTLFLSLGVWEERKGFHVLLNQLLEYPSRWDKNGWKFTIVGSGGDSHYKERLWAKAYDTNPNIKEDLAFHDYSIINACDVLVVPSIRDEDFPNVILIALMYGRPVVVNPSVGGLKEIIVDGYNGYHVDTEAGEKFIPVFEGMNRRAIGRMGGNCREDFAEFYRPSVILNKWISLWNSFSE